MSSLSKRANDTVAIYLLTNKITGKVYVGQTWYPYSIRMGKNGCNYKNSPYLYLALQKYGCDAFEYTTLEVHTDQAMADEREDYYIKQYNSRNHTIGYNLQEGGWSGKHSEETKKKISNSLIGHKMSESNRLKLIGNTFALGSIHTDEWKENNSIRSKIWHQENEHPMLGRHHTDIAKKLIGEASVGRQKSEEGIARIKEANLISKEKEDEMILLYQLETNDSTETNKEYMYEVDDLNIIMNFSTRTLYAVLKRRNIPLRENKAYWTDKPLPDDVREKQSIAYAVKNNPALNKQMEDTIVRAYFARLSFAEICSTLAISNGKLVALKNRLNLPKLPNVTKYVTFTAKEIEEQESARNQMKNLVVKINIEIGGQDA